MFHQTSKMMMKIVVEVTESARYKINKNQKSHTKHDGRSHKFGVPVTVCCCFYFRIMLESMVDVKRRELCHSLFPFCNFRKEVGNFIREFITGTRKVNSTAVLILSQVFV